MNKQNILLLCKVVDNFGDIGVVYRLAKALSDLRPDLNLTLVVSNLKSFSAMAKQVEPDKKIQDFKYKNSVWKILDWNLDEKNDEELKIAKKAANENEIILECFQCGRPDWLEDILFSDEFKKTIQIVNIDYLTAEEYADEFHLLRSGTRKMGIRKINFMPGFTDKTGGLIFETKVIDSTRMNTDFTDEHGLQEIKDCRIQARTATNVRESDNDIIRKINNDKYFNISFFAYERDCAPVVNAISHFQEKMRKNQKDFSVCVFVAAGKSFLPFVDSWKKAGEPFKIEKLPFLPQEEWDFLLTQMDFNFVRGEDSLSRAALSGLPYVWNAYIQDEDYQLVKVDALLERMKTFFAEDDFAVLKNAWNLYNQKKDEEKLEKLIFEFLLRSASSEKMIKGFKNYATSIKKNGNLAQHLLDYIDSL